MAEKMVCPGCDSYSSSVLTAYMEDRPCPICGLSPQAMREIETIRDSRASEELKEKLETTIKAHDKTQRESRALTARLTQMQRDLESLLDLAKKPLQPNEDRGW